jgi:hypothetical protein
MDVEVLMLKELVHKEVHGQLPAFSAAACFC